MKLPELTPSITEGSRESRTDDRKDVWRVWRQHEVLSDGIVEPRWLWGHFLTPEFVLRPCSMFCRCCGLGCQPGVEGNGPVYVMMFGGPVSKSVSTMAKGVIFAQDSDCVGV